MIRFTPYLMRMAICIAFVAAVAGVLWAGVAGAFLANAWLNGLIIALFVVGVVYTIRSVMVLRPEAAWMEQFQASGDSEQRSTVAPPRLLGPMAKMLSEQQGQLRLSAMSMRSLLDGIHARLDENRELSRYLIGLLIFLGLLGTFWGLLRTIGSVADVIGGLTIEGGDLALVFSDLKAGLEAPLGGMGTAFSSSLFGLAGSLVLGFLELQATQAQNRFYNELEDWLSGAARVTTGASFGVEGDGNVPAYLQALIEQTAENLDTLRRVMSQGEESRKQGNANLMALTERLGTLTDQMRTEQNLMIGWPRARWN